MADYYAKVLPILAILYFNRTQKGHLTFSDLKIRFGFP